MKRRKVSRAKLASRMKTTPAALDRLFAPDHSSVTLQLLEQAALALAGSSKWNWRDPLRQYRSAIQ